MPNRRSRGYTLVELLVCVGCLACLALVVVVSSGACSSSSGREQALRAAEIGGLDGARITGEHWAAPGWYGCGKGDGVAYEVTGRDRHEKQVDAVVCCGGPLAWKGCTFRTK